MNNSNPGNRTKAHTARKRFGQNFLHDQNIINQIISCIAPRADDHMVEIGPGLGALTQPLLSRAGKLIAIELDRDLIEHLQLTCDSKKLQLHSADALQFNYATLADTLPSPARLRIVGNLPYNISSPLLFHLLQYRTRIQDMHFMLQKEVVDRIVADPGSRAFGRLSVMLQYYCEAEALFEVPPEAFSPAPKVRSAVIRLRPKPDTCTVDVPFGWLEQATQQAFSTRRKTLRNNFRNVLTIETLQSAGLDPGARAETLPITDFVKLAKLMHSQSE